MHSVNKNWPAPDKLCWLSQTTMKELTVADRERLLYSLLGIFSKCLESADFNNFKSILGLFPEIEQVIIK